jgi:hypothetical protein
MQHVALCSIGCGKSQTLGHYMEDGGVSAKYFKKGLTTFDLLSDKVVPFQTITLPS